MAYITAERKADVESDLAAALAFIAWLDLNITDASSTGRSAGTRRYDFDSGTGRQSETFNSPIEMINSRKSEVATRDRLRRELGGQLIMTQQIRR